MQETVKHAVLRLLDVHGMIAAERSSVRWLLTKFMHFPSLSPRERAYHARVCMHASTCSFAGYDELSAFGFANYMLEELEGSDLRVHAPTAAGAAQPHQQDAAPGAADTPAAAAAPNAQQRS